MSDAAPPPWVKAAPGLSAAHKFMLQVLWGYGPYAREELWVTIDGDRQPRTPARCWEPCEELAKLTDQPAGTVRKQLRKLAADGWILRGSGSMRTLAWRAPGVFAYGAGGTSAHPLSTGAPGQECSPPVHTAPPSDHEVPPRVTTDAPQTLQEPSIQLSNDLEVEARAFPPPPRHQAAQTSLVTGKPSASQTRAQAQLDSERAERHALIDRQQAELRLAKLDETKSLLTAACTDPWPAKVRAASESAAYHLDQSDGPAPSYGGLMTQARANYGDEAVLEVLERWESDLPGHRPRPPANKLWWRSWVPWVEAVLDIKPPQAKPQAESPFAFHPQPELTVVGSMT